MRPAPEAPLTRRERRALAPQNAMHAPEPLPDVLAESAPAVVVTPVVHATRRSSRAVSVPPVPVPAGPVLHVTLPSAEAAPLAAEEPVVEVIEAASTTTAPDEPVDLFIEAARALNFTGETPLAASDEPRPAMKPAAPRSSTPRTRHSGVRRVATLTASIGAFGVVGLLAVGMTTPFSALASTKSASAPGTSIAAGADDDDIQAFVAPAQVENAQIERSSGYEATTFAEMAEVSGINTAGAFYVNDPTADIQWPIVVGTSKSFGFGQRWGRLHEGIDFTPGAGAPVQAIAGGTVRIGSYGAYGNNVYIDHVIDGQRITSHYAHMQDGSIRVTEGQHVEVGDVIGLVGNTGRSFGAHLHFELRLPSNQSIDPLPWLQEHAGVHFPKEEDAAEAGSVAGEADGE
ncbi:M23 family metallopeptidase [Microbacterium rhizophilus]|uniref:M23 family metallopeptidase n=1 Tax=Microbacterium rhizophilus TaxID=3138934 RepID=UPI0031EFD224